ncbi:MAG: HAD hydrolase-like protein, partial [Parasporobacterium sp.]|nr:HAD hydrolase-like protein [Parasporobacterium sp.]
MLKNIFFDLDGTLTDSAPGIMNSIRYALEKMDYPIPDEATLRLFVGPPLTDSYMEVCGMTEEEAFKGLELYRVYFADKGMFENLPYPGIKECLKELKDKGFRMFLATSKPEEYAKIIMDHFELSEYFCDICGASMDEKRNTKDAVIQYCMDKNNIAPEETIMIG